jgi:hypothetical protein
LGTVSAFHIPPSMTRLPTVPNGVSARDANAATPPGSAYMVPEREQAEDEPGGSPGLGRSRALRCTIS